MRLLFLCFLLSIAMFGCQSQKPLLYGEEWKLIRMNETDYTGLEQPITLFINQNDNKVSGFGGCNRYFGTLKLNENSFKLSEIGSTKMYCTETMPVEDAYFKLLHQVDHFEINENQLLLSSQGVIVLVFSH